MKKNLLEELKNRILVIDGAMGTMLMNAGIRPDENFDLQNIKKPEIVKAVHRAYVDAGADLIETNTFGANRLKIGDKVKEVNHAAVKLAKEAAGEKAFVVGSVGPIGKLLAPYGELSFDEARMVFAEQITAISEAGADAISIETISDIQEMRAALIAAKESTSIPIIASMTYEKDGRTIFGTPIEAAAVTIESLGADIISLNCSTGPEDMIPLTSHLSPFTSLPIMVMPNAGMPELIGGKAVYKMTPETFGKHAAEFIKLGVSIVGGCCGTSPKHIEEVAKTIKSMEPRIHSQVPQKNPKFSSRTRVIEVKEGKFFVVGERINPTGRKALREEIKAGKLNTIRQEAVEQAKARADLLDINISIPMGDDAAIMQKAVETAVSASDLPLSIDSPNINAIESGLKNFPGRALLNSVNGKKEILEKVLPLVKKYGAMVIGLCLDENGIPKTVAEKVAIAKKIIAAAEKEGIAKDLIFIDTLVMTAAVSIDEALETLKAIPEVKKLGVKTILGVSNCSHGLPHRSTVNGIYLKLARIFGLDAGIIDPLDPEINKALAYAPKENDKDRLIEELRNEVKKSFNMPTLKEEKVRAGFKPAPTTGNIKNMVIMGDAESCAELVAEALLSQNPQDIINNGLIAGMEIVGGRFSKKEIFLPQVLNSAEAMKKGFELCKAKIPKDQIKSAGKVILATVEGDIHDIGKNIVKMMLENHGFTVIDLGKDVPAKKIIEAAVKEKPAAIALSALLTTTMLEMKHVKEELARQGLNIPVIVGGAVVTNDFAAEIGAMHGEDAACAVTLAKEILSRLHS